MDIYHSLIQANYYLVGWFSYDSTGKDLYGRVLADIWINNQRLDSTLISNGWAWHYQTI
jgi:endonuclease YncB( thermonuclease family)